MGKPRASRRRKQVERNIAAGEVPLADDLAVIDEDGQQMRLPKNWQPPAEPTVGERRWTGPSSLFVPADADDPLSALRGVDDRMKAVLRDETVATCLKRARFQASLALDAVSHGGVPQGRLPGPAQALADTRDAVEGAFSVPVGRDGATLKDAWRDAGLLLPEIDKALNQLGTRDGGVACRRVLHACRSLHNTSDAARGRT